MPTEKLWPIEAYLAERVETAIRQAGFTLPEGARIDVEVPASPSTVTGHPGRADAREDRAPPAAAGAGGAADALVKGIERMS